MCLNPYPPHYRAAFAFSDLLYPHTQQSSLRLTCPFGRIYGLTVFRVSNNRSLGGDFFPGRLRSRLGREQSQSRSLTFWLLPDSIFGSSKLTEFIVTSLSFTMLPEPSSPPRDARSSAFASRRRLHPFGMGYIVEEASDITVTSGARSSRLLPGKWQVH